MLEVNIVYISYLAFKTYFALELITKVSFSSIIII